MSDQAPGNILQKMHFRRRVRALQNERDGNLRLIEIGTGRGWLSAVCLDEGCTGVGFDLNEEACQANRARNATAIEAGRYTVVNGDFMESSDTDSADLLFSCMVIEHLSQQELDDYFGACLERLAGGGRMTVFVPAQMRYWGIEDQVAGHYTRYDTHQLQAVADRHELQLNYSVGLTFPISNVLLPLSNALVSRTERRMLDRNMKERTVASGSRHVPFKTQFPFWLGLLLNEYTMLPFDLLQRCFSWSSRSMVMYAEFTRQVSHTPVDAS